MEDRGEAEFSAYLDTEYQELEAALMRAVSISHGRPDQFQFYQNELTRHLAHFILKPYRMKKLQEMKENKD